MNQVYIVSNYQWLFVVHRSKAGAKEAKRQAIADGEDRVIIKKRF